MKTFLAVMLLLAATLVHAELPKSEAVLIHSNKSGLNTYLIKDAQSPVFTKTGLLFFKLAFYQIEGSGGAPKGQMMLGGQVVNCDTQQYKHFIIAARLDENSEVEKFPVDVSKIDTASLEPIKPGSLLSSITDMLCKKPEASPPVTPSQPSKKGLILI